MTRTCPVCQKSYQADPQRVKHGRQLTCSRRCSYIFRGNTSTRKVTLSCLACGAPYTKSPSQIQRVKHASFCSQACHYNGRTLGLSKRIVTKPYQYTEESKKRLVQAAQKPKGQRVWHMRVCLNCRVPFHCSNNGRHRKSGMTFCSLVCCNAYRKGSNNPSWRGGHPRYYGPDWRAMRRAARSRDGHICRRCGTKPERRPDVHHIRPVSSFENPNEAHTLDNLVTLCHPCHMWVEWHGIDF